MKEKILVTGGAGFIGTHTVIELIQAGHQVVVVDNLVNSNRKSLEVVERITGVEVPFYEADIRDTDTLRDIFKQEEPTGVIHFAGLKAVGESTRIPLAYYDNNIAGTVSLLKAMEENNCKNIIFSSSATVYGDPQNGMWSCFVTLTQSERMKVETWEKIQTAFQTTSCLMLHK